MGAKADLQWLNDNAANGQGSGGGLPPSPPVNPTPADSGDNASGKSYSSYSSSYYDLLKQISDQNNAFNLAQVEMVNSFNAHEAQKNRDWQERMSNTAHQREVQDLIAAGLNPILSANGQGAYTGSGATASGQKAVADNILGNGMISLLTASMNAASAQSVARIYANASVQSALINAQTQGNKQENDLDIALRKIASSGEIADKNNATKLIQGLPTMILGALIAEWSKKHR